MTVHGGARGPITPSKSAELVYPTTARIPAAIPNGVRSIVAPAAQRLTERMLEPVADIASRDSYVRNLIGDLNPATGKAKPIQMLLAIGYDVIVSRGKPLSDATAYLHEMLALFETWAAEVDGQRVELPDVRSALLLEARREGAENEVSIVAASDQDNPQILQRLIDVSEAERDATDDVIECARRRLVLLENGRSA